MRFISRRHATIATAVLTTVSLVGVAPVRAAVRTFGKNYQVTATVKGAQNMTVLLMSAKGQTLASASVSKSSQKITLKTAPTASTKGATLQLVSGAGKAGKGAYYGPVVIGWKGTKASTASKVTSKLKASSSTKISLGTVQVKSAVGSAKQGYAVALAASKLADTSTASLAKASKGKPSGVGNYGKNQSVSSGDFTVSIAAVGDPCSPPGTQTCGPDGREIGAPNSAPNQPAAGGAAVADDDLNGGDKDDDGIPNAFDVNDDGDAVVDSADSSTPSPKVGVEAAATCAQVDFKIFTNYKATQAGFAGTINAYGTGAFKATLDNIASTITKSMTMVFSPITSVCGSAVTATYLKGNGVAYAPTDYVKLGGTCNTGDYQWAIGQGFICPGAGNKTAFGGHTFTGTDLPTGQDTFSMKVETADGNSYEFTSSPGFVFVTHPMFTAYSTDGVTYTNIDYSQTTVGPDGTRLTSDPVISVSQSQTLWLKVYRPQRLPIDGETGTFYDLGGFKWTPDIPNGNPSPGKCDALTSTDTTMTNDTAIDETGKPQLILQWSIGSQCYGKAPRNAAWQAGGGDFDIQVEPTGPGGNAAQKVRITLA